MEQIKDLFNNYEWINNEEIDGTYIKYSFTNNSYGDSSFVIQNNGNDVIVSFPLKHRSDYKYSVCIDSSYTDLYHYIENILGYLHE